MSNPTAHVCNYKRAMMKIREELWLRIDSGTGVVVEDPDKEWDAGTIERVAEVLIELGLRPETVKRIQLDQKGTGYRRRKNSSR